jgi:hypothetical protein
MAVAAAGTSMNIVWNVEEPETHIMVCLLRIWQFVRNNGSLVAGGIM